MYPFDIPKAPGANAPGLGKTVFIAPLPWFDTIQMPGTTPTNPGDSVIITTDHTFLNLPTPSPAPSPMPSPVPKYGFIKAYTTTGTGSAKIAQVGSPDNWGIEKTFEAQVPGASAAWFELMAENGEYILLLPHEDCSSTTFLQFGTLCDPALSDGIEWNSGKKGATDPRGFTIKFKSYSTKPLLYTGTVATVGSWS